MQFADVASQLDPEIYRRMRAALETGKWPDGRILTRQQKEIAMEAVIHFERSNNIPENQRVGYMEDACKSSPEPDSAPLRFVGQDNGGQA